MSLVYFGSLPVSLWTRNGAKVGDLAESDVVDSTYIELRGKSDFLLTIPLLSLEPN